MKRINYKHCLTSIFFLFLSSCLSLSAQDLQERLTQSNQFKRIGNRSASLQLLNQVIAESEAANNYEIKAQALYEKAEWYKYYIQYDSAIAHGAYALQFVEQKKLQRLLPKFLLQNGWLVLRKYDTENALIYCRKAKELAIQEKQPLIQVECDACIEDALGIYYLGALGDDYYYPVLKAYEKLVTAHKEEGNTSKYASYLTRYIDLYRLQGKADSVKLLLQELEDVLTNYQDYRLESSLYSLKSIYAYFENDLDAVYQNLRKAQEKSRQLGLDRLTQHYYFRLHDYYKDLKKYEQSIQMLDSAKAIYHVDHMHAQAFDLYYYVYKEAGNTEKALEYIEKWHNDEDWKRKNEKVELITEWETKYKTQEKEILIEKGRIQRYWLLAFLGLVFVFSLFLVYAYRKQKKNANQLVLQNQIIEQQANELQQLDKVKSRFFANVSHELRTPLTLILGPINSILQKGDLNNRNFTLLKLVQNNGNQLLKLINSILDLSRLESGKLALKEEDVALYPLMHRILSQFESGAQLQEIVLAIDYQLDPYLKVQLDVSKFETVVNNLLSNALKFTPKGGRIELVCKDLGNKIGIEVTDSGAGIHPDDLPRIFDRFYQSKQTDAPTEGGSGIGLALSKELAHLFHGDLSAESELGKGSTFYFNFPKKEVLGFIKEEITAIPPLTKPDTKVEQTSITLPEREKQSEKPNLLIVEDNPSLRQYLQVILGEKYQLSLAENGKAALETLKQLPECKLIISDVMMPIMDGYQLLETLKADEQWRTTPIIMLTARAALDDKLKALRIGVDDYILKPFEEEELIVRIENLLQHQEERQQVNTSQEIETKENVPPVSQADLEWLKHVEESIQKQIDNTQFTINELADTLFISERQLSRKIKKLTGLTPNKYIREIKLQKARALLETRTFSTVAKVSYAVGFSKAEYFSQLYKERFGKLPSAYLI